ncbi:MAG: DUF434 domain-containing protein, partial [Polyangiales bacterium]
MGDSRRHRGPHPRDEELFSDDARPTLSAAVRDLSWLRARGYAEASAIKLVGDRYQLHRRQRVAVARCACSESARERRASRQSDASDLAGKSLMIDGFNVVTTIEVALAGGVLLVGQDQCMRDMASYHGSYRLVQETEQAVEILVDVIASLRPAETLVYIDRPVSNSGRLAQTIREASARRGVPIGAIAADGVDELLKTSTAVVATSDSAILDRCGQWLNLARLAVDQQRPHLSL